MEEMRNGEENGTSHWIPYMFFDRSSVTIHLLKWFGLGSSSPSSTFKEEDVMETKEEEDDITVDITERRLQKSKPNPKPKPKPKPSPGTGGQVH
ncbi:elicitor peptide 3 [Raphanus sativus]|uniref:Elicitor peptide 3 n=1 Tax=Raphanus sativus TaxID=3726 RepID=A0A6J0NTR8_RAPSA|nr:elicitor peptide 3 [Raphanus sativus]